MISKGKVVASWWIGINHTNFLISQGWDINFFFLISLCIGNLYPGGCLGGDVEASL